MIEAQGLTKDYGRHRAVDDVSFRIEAGQIVGLLGPNGSGKTTIMRMLTGFFPPTAATPWRHAGRSGTCPNRWPCTRT